jgi:hypothetical protein
MRTSFLLVAITVVFFSCKKEIEVNAIRSDASNNLATPITSVKASYWDSVFTRYGGGWTGGDQAVSYKLPDGRFLWLFGDSFVDTVYPNRKRPITGFIHNTMVTMDAAGGNFTTYKKGTAKNPQPYFQATGKSYYWPVFTFMNTAKTQVYVFLDKIKPTSGTGSFAFKVTGVDVAILNYPDLTIQQITPFSTGDFINWAGAAMENDDDYIYLYGTESTQYNKFIHIARTPKATPLSNVTYFDGTNWVNDPLLSKRMQGGVSESFSFFKNQGKYYLVSQENLLGPNIYIWDAQSPTGPFTRKRLIYTTPQLAGTVPLWTYNASAHIELNQNNQLLVGYCANSQTSAGLYSNADSYRPYFVWATNWQ